MQARAGGLGGALQLGDGLEGLGGDAGIPLGDARLLVGLAHLALCVLPDRCLALQQATKLLVSTSLQSC